jgi:hypothetical protein
MKKAVNLLCVSFFMTFLLIPYCQASIVYSTPNIISSVASSPLNLTEGQVQSNDNIFVYYEGITKLNQNLSVDISSSGTYTYNLGLTSSSIANNTSVKSYLIHYDPTSNNQVNSTIGALKFSDNILGIIINNSLLITTDSIFGPAGVTYSNDSQWRGLEFLQSSNYDTLILGQNMRDIALSFYTTSGIDEVRVLTAVPIPPAVWLLGSGLVCLIGIRRKLKN